MAATTASFTFSRYDKLRETSFGRRLGSCARAAEETTGEGTSVKATSRASSWGQWWAASRSALSESEYLSM
jgi:hypothetical protein